MTTERVSAFCVYWIAAFLGWMGGFDVQDVASLLGVVLGTAMFIVSWYYRRKTYQLLVAGKISGEEYERANR